MHVLATLFCLLLLKSPQATTTEVIPAVNKATVTVDGRVSQGEWEKAFKVATRGGASIYFLCDPDSLYIGVFAGERASHYTDLYFNGASRLNLHASMQLGERVLPGSGTWDDAVPAWEWGNNAGWTANTVAYLPGVSDTLPLIDQIVPYAGQEFRIARSKLGSTFSVMVLARSFVDESFSVFPDGATRDAASWGNLQLK